MAHESPRRAILLAAGRGRRLGSDHPKCLLMVAGKSLLQRHFENLLEAGVTDVTIVTGFHEEKVKAFVAHKKPSLDVRFITNPRFERGSIVSLQVASDLLSSGAIWMDADVIYPTARMKRLVESPHDNCVLLDRRSEETGEEMMLGVRDGRVCRLARKISQDGPFDVMGEAVGFAKVGKEGGAAMTRILQTEVSAGRLDQEYEAAMNTCFGEVPWGFEPVDDFDWTEIDFQEDVEKAERIAQKIG